MARAGSLNTPGPFNFPISRAPACAAESPKLSLPGAAPGRLANGVVADIRLLNGTMQVELLPAAPLPGGVKVARRFVKPHGVGASPTLAANFRDVCLQQ